MKEKEKNSSMFFVLKKKEITIEITIEFVIEFPEDY